MCAALGVNPHRLRPVELGLDRISPWRSTGRAVVVPAHDAQCGISPWRSTGTGVAVPAPDADVKSRIRHRSPVRVGSGRVLAADILIEPSRRALIDQRSAGTAGSGSDVGQGTRVVTASLISRWALRPGVRCGISHRAPSRSSMGLFLGSIRRPSVIFRTGGPGCCGGRAQLVSLEVGVSPRLQA